MSWEWEERGKTFLYYISLERERKKVGRILLEHAYTHTREGRGKRRDKRHGRDARHGTRVTRGGKIIKKST